MQAPKKIHPRPFKLQSVTSADASLIREYVSMMMTDVPPPSRARRRLRGLVSPDRLLGSDLSGFYMSEDYVRGVLGVDRGGMLVEGFSHATVSQVVLTEHLIFEGFWSDAWKSTKEFLEDNPVSNGIEAAAKAKNNIQAIVVTLSSVVATGGDAIATVVEGAKNLLSKGLLSIKKSIGDVVQRLKDLAGRVTTTSIAGAMNSIAEKLAGAADTLVQLVSDAISGAGWKVMLAAIACFLAIVALRGKIAKLATAALGILSGKAADMAKGALTLGAEVKGVLDALPGDDEEEKSIEAQISDAEESTRTGAAAAAQAEGLYLKAAKIIAGALKGLAWGFVKKIIGAAGIAAVEQLSGPVGWIKKLAEVFEKVAGGVAWVSEHILAAIKRATFKPGGSAPAASGT